MTQKEFEDRTRRLITAEDYHWLKTSTWLLETWARTSSARR